MKLLDGRDIAQYIKERHRAQVSVMDPRPRMAIIRSEHNVAGDKYLKMKRAYGKDIGVDVDFYVEKPATMVERIHKLNRDKNVTGILIQLPLEDASQTAAALAAVAPEKDVDGLGPDTKFEPGTVKASLWLLAAYNVPVQGKVVIVGQGRLVGKPLADRLEASGVDVHRIDIRTKDLKAALQDADMIFTGTGKPGLIKSDMVKDGAVVVDTGSPRGELEPSLYERKDLTITPNPGGVGPMTVASLFDNLLIAQEAANRKQNRG